MYWNTCRVVPMARSPVSNEDKEFGRRLGAVLREARDALGMSAQALASASGLSIDTVRSIESGRTSSPSFVTVIRMADALGVSLDRLRSASHQDAESS